MKKKKKIILFWMICTPPILFGVFIGLMVHMEAGHKQRGRTIRTLTKTDYAVHEYYAEFGKYPESLDLLFSFEKVFPFIEEYKEIGFNDEWGQPLYYKATATNRILLSLGVDQKLFTDDDIRLDDF